MIRSDMVVQRDDHEVRLTAVQYATVLGRGGIFARLQDIVDHVTGVAERSVLCERRI